MRYVSWIHRSVRLSNARIKVKTTSLSCGCCLVTVTENTVKRVLLPLNTGQNSHGVHIADDGEGGHHWILAELNLSSNEVHLFDWMGNSPPKDYQQVSGVFLWSCAPCVAVLSQTNPATENIIRLWLSLSSTTLRVAHCDAPEVPWCVCPRFR